MLKDSTHRNIHTHIQTHTHTRKHTVTDLAEHMHNISMHNLHPLNTHSASFIAQAAHAPSSRLSQTNTHTHTHRVVIHSMVIFTSKQSEKEVECVVT